MDGGTVAALRLAARQYGVLRLDQARAAGMSEWQVRRRVACGAWEELFPTVYRVEGAPPTWRQQLKAASLWAEKSFAVSHRSAAALWGFDRYREGPVELSVTRHLRTYRPCVVHQVERLTQRDLASIDGLCVTSATRTLLDLAAIEPEAQVRAAVDQALRRKWTTLERLASALGEAGRRRGVAFLKDLVHAYLGGDGPTESELEARVQDLLEAQGFPRAVKQRPVFIGGRLRRLDFLVPGTRVVIEADGYAWHASPAQFEKDRARNNALTAQGYLVLHWTWAALRERPETLVAQLHALLGRGGAFLQL